MSDEILKNSKARRDYEIIETLEAGLVLRGTEVKSLRAGKGQLRESFARVDLSVNCFKSYLSRSSRCFFTQCVRVIAICIVST